MKRRNWIVIGLVVAAGIIILGQPTAISIKLRMIFAQLSTPFVRLGDHIPAVKFRRDLEQQNQQLRAENNELRQQVRALSETGFENVRLNELLAFKRHTGVHALGARVIGRDASNWWRSLQLDRGTDDGLRANLPVVTADGVVGKIVTLTRTESRVLLLQDPNCQASAFLQDSRQHGVVAGNGPGDESVLRMTFVDRATRVRVGETVMTSGLGGVFPKGLLLGTVARSRLNPETGMYLDIQLKPAVDFRRLEEVLVITE